MPSDVATGLPVLRFTTLHGNGRRKSKCPLSRATTETKSSFISTCSSPPPITETYLPASRTRRLKKRGVSPAACPTVMAFAVQILLCRNRSPASHLLILTFTERFLFPRTSNILYCPFLLQLIFPVSTNFPFATYSHVHPK